MRLIDADAFKAELQERLESFEGKFKTNMGYRVAKLTTEAFIKDIDAQPTIEPEKPFEEI